MADVQIEAAAQTTSFNFGSQAGPVFVDHDIGYFFYVNSSIDLVYKKTTDGGSTWGGAVTIKTGSVADYAVWFDKWTPGGTGTVIHIAYMEVPDSTSVILFYRSLDTSGDSRGSEITVQDTTVTGGASATTSIRTATADSSSVSITKAQGGNLYASLRAHVEFTTDNEVDVFERSTDGGANWTARTAVTEAEGTDTVILVPADTSDSQDIAGIYIDGSANAISIKMYDDSANTWTETAITSITEQASIWNCSVAIRHSDQHAILAFVNAGASATTDLQVYDLTLDNIAAPTVTAKTNVLTDTAQMQDCSVFIDQNTDDIYVMYLQGGTFLATVNVVYKLSQDGGGTWGSPVQISEDAADDHRHVYAGHSSPGAADGRFYGVWFNDDLDDMLGGFTNSVTVDGGAAAPSGTIAATLQAAVGNFTGEQPYSGAIAATLLAALANFTGVMQPSGALAATMQEPTFAGAGVHGAYTGQIEAAIQMLTMAASGSIPTEGTLAAALQNLLFSGIGEQPFTAVMAAVMQELEFAGEGISVPFVPFGSGRVAYVPSTLKRLPTSDVALVRREIRSP